MGSEIVAASEAIAVAAASGEAVAAGGIIEGAAASKVAAASASGSGMALGASIVAGTFLFLGVGALAARYKFRQALNNAKIAGKFLALALTLQHPFNKKTISLLGFSLGT